MMLDCRIVSQGPSTEIAAEMDDAVDALADRLDLREIGEIGRHEFFVGLPRSAGALMSLSRRSG